MSALFAAGGPGYYGDAIERVAEVIAASSVIDGVFVSRDAVWGTKISGGWTHFNITPPDALLWKRKDLTPFQRRAALLEDHRTLTAAIDAWKPEVVTQAVTMLEADALYRGNAVVGMAKFLMNIQNQVRLARKELRPNLIWQAVATAPAGWASMAQGCVLRSLSASICSYHFSSCAWLMGRCASR